MTVTGAAASPGHAKNGVIYNESRYDTYSRGPTRRLQRCMHDAWATREVFLGYWVTTYCISVLIAHDVKSDDPRLHERLAELRVGHGVAREQRARRDAKRSSLEVRHDPTGLSHQ